VDQRGTVFTRAEFLHAFAGTGSATTRHLYRLVSSRNAGRRRRRWVICPASRSDSLALELALCVRRGHRLDQGSVLRIATGSGGDRGDRHFANREEGFAKCLFLVGGSARVRGDLFLQDALWADNSRSGIPGSYRPSFGARAVFCDKSYQPSAETFAAARSSANAGAYASRRRCLSRTLDCSDFGYRDHPRVERHTRSTRDVLQQGSADHIRRSIRRAALCRAAGGRALSVGEHLTNDGRTSPGGNNPWPTHYGPPIRRLHGAWQNPGGLPPLFAATLGAAITTFLPCFLFILVFAPLVDRLRHFQALDAALSTITAAVVGVILNLAVWFRQHVLFPLGQPDFYAIFLALLFFSALAGQMGDHPCGVRRRPTRPRRQIPTWRLTPNIEVPLV
jgi:Chromate transporter